MKKRQLPWQSTLLQGGIEPLRWSWTLLTTQMLWMSGPLAASLLNFLEEHPSSQEMTTLIKSRELLLSLEHPQLKIWLLLEMTWPESTFENYPRETSRPGRHYTLKLTLLPWIWLGKCLSSILRKDTRSNNVWSTPTLKACTMKRLSLNVKNHLIGLGMILSQRKTYSRIWSTKNLLNSIQMSLMMKETNEIKYPNYYSTY